MPTVYEHRVQVTARDIDDQGHANNLVYLRWMQEAAISHSAAQGWDPQRYVATDTAWIVRSHHIEYLQAAYEDDELIIRTWVADFRKVTSLRRYEIRRRDEDQLLVRAATDWAFVTRSTQRPRRIPAEVRSAFEVIEQKC